MILSKGRCICTKLCLSIEHERFNPPYSLKDWNKKGLTQSDPRFEIAGVLPPANKGDYAFLLHGLYHVGPDGVMAIVLPHGLLFRGAAEGDIR